MAKDLKLKVTDLIAQGENSLNQTRKLCYGKIGLLTLKDIIKELEKPGLDLEKQLRFSNLIRM
jgi:uncharacterized protein